MGTEERHPPAKRILAANVKTLIGHHKQSVPDAARHIKMQLYQLKRILKGEQDVRMDTLERIADGYGIEAYQLLIPGLDPINPQVHSGRLETRRFMALTSGNNAKWVAFGDGLLAGQSETDEPHSSLLAPKRRGPHRRGNTQDH